MVFNFQTIKSNTNQFDIFAPQKEDISIEVSNEVLNSIIKAAKEEYSILFLVCKSGIRGNMGISKPNY